MPSSVILKTSYNPTTTTLTITFISGKIYDYENVPEDVHVAMKTSASKGIFFNKHIKGQYEFKTMDEK